MKWYLFAKFFQQYSVDELMEYCAEEGLDGPTALVRNGYWTPPDRLAETLPDYVECARKFGLEVRYADTPIDFADEKQTSEAYRILADCGIQKLRLEHIDRKGKDPRMLADLGRRFAEKACEYGQRYSVQSIIQIHGGCYPLNATSAWPMVRNLDSRYVSVKIDPGNNFAQEGFERFSYQVELLRGYIGALGAKDACSLRVGEEGEDKGWRSMMMPAYAGQTNYTEVFRLLKTVGFDGPAILMPFYTADNFDGFKNMLRKEIAYLKKCEATAQT